MSTSRFIGSIRLEFFKRKRIATTCGKFIGSGCGSVGRAVATNTRGLRFKSSHLQKFIYILSTVNCVLKRRKKEKEAWHILKNFIASNLGLVMKIFAKVLVNFFNKI